MRYPRGYPPVCQRPLFGHILRTTCTSRPTRCGSLPFRMFCVLCRDSLRGVSSVNLECCFVWVWPQRQTFVRKSLTIQNRTSAQSSRPTVCVCLAVVLTTISQSIGVVSKRRCGVCVSCVCVCVCDLLCVCGFVCGMCVCVWLRSDHSHLRVD